MNEPTKNTLVFPIEDNRVLLGMKKRGFGAGWWNGFGGKQEAGETFEQAARREVLEEAGIKIGNLKPVARLLFYFKNELDIACQAYTSDDFEGDPKETEEMRPKWFSRNVLPYDSMWEADRLWVPQALSEDLKESLSLAVYFDSSNHYERIEWLSASAIEAYFH